MAIIAGQQAGKPCVQVNGATDSRAPIRYGVSANATAVGATAVQLTLPTDPQGNAYSAYLIYTAGPIWYAFNTGSGAATAAGANCYLQNNGAALISPPAGATGLSAIADSGTTNAISVIGVY